MIVYLFVLFGLLLLGVVKSPFIAILYYGISLLILYFRSKEEGKIFLVLGMCFLCPALGGIIKSEIYYKNPLLLISIWALPPFLIIGLGITLLMPKETEKQIMARKKAILWGVVMLGIFTIVVVYFAYNILKMY